MSFSILSSRNILKCSQSTSSTKGNLSDPSRTRVLANNSDPVVSYFHLAGVPAPDTSAFAGSHVPFDIVLFDIAAGLLGNR